MRERSYPAHNFGWKMRENKTRGRHEKDIGRKKERKKERRKKERRKNKKKKKEIIAPNRDCACGGIPLLGRPALFGNGAGEAVGRLLAGSGAGGRGNA